MCIPHHLVLSVLACALYMAQISVQGSRDRWFFPVDECRCLPRSGHRLGSHLHTCLCPVCRQLHAGQHCLLCQYAPSGLLYRYVILMEAVDAFSVVSIVRSVRFLVDSFGTHTSAPGNKV